MSFEKRNITDSINRDTKKRCDLEELMHDQDLDALYIELMLSSDEAIESVLHDLEGDR